VLSHVVDALLAENDVGAFRGDFFHHLLDHVLFLF
jgi:hypothetical protein